MTKVKQLSFLCTLAFLLTSLGGVRVYGQEQRSLGDIAREIRDKKPEESQLSWTDSKELLAETDKILHFASEDSGYTKRMAVKRQIISRDDLQKMIERESAKSDDKELVRSEVVMKKFGLLPPQFDLKQFGLKNGAKAIAGFYVPKEKTMYLMNCVALTEQRPVMAHELTHALQDQNFDLITFDKRDKASGRRVKRNGSDAEQSDARRAMIEGQAMVVYMDFMGKEHGVSLSENPQAMEFFSNLLTDYETPVRLKNAPKILKDAGMFPYREGLAFELEVLRKSDRQSAFAGMFARPPQSTHEILDPQAYIHHTKPAIVALPDVHAILGDAFETYDSGTMGELDVRVMATEFGRENDIYSVARKWDGGSYIVVRRRSEDSTAKPRSADLALLYVSRWKTPEAAARFAKIYVDALPKRVNVVGQSTLDWSCAGKEKCQTPLWSTRVMTDEGATFAEVWPGNTLIIAQSFDDETMSSLRNAVLSAKQRSEPASQSDHELSMSLYESETFAAVAEQIREEVAKDLLRYLELQH